MEPRTGGPSSTREAHATIPSMQHDRRLTMLRRRRPGWIWLVTAAILLASCGSTAPSGPAVSPSPTVPAATASGVSPSVAPSPLSSAELSAIYTEINGQVRAIRGLDEKVPVEPTILSREQMGQLLTKQLAEESPAPTVAAYERLY